MKTGHAYVTSKNTTTKMHSLIVLLTTLENG